MNTMFFHNSKLKLWLPIKTNKTNKTCLIYFKNFEKSRVINKQLVLEYQHTTCVN
jgi:hypothetical protein